MQTNINNTSINQSLLNAYSSASYHVYTKPAFIIKINQYSADLESLYVLHHKNTAAFITAFNPYSQALDLNENHKRNDSLKEAIELLELSYTKGDGRCGENNEVGEESFLIIGISKEQSIQLGTESEQNAIVFCDKDAIPQLLLLK